METETSKKTNHKQQLTLDIRLSLSSSTSGDHPLMSFSVRWLMLTAVSWPVWTPISGNSSMNPLWRKSGTCWTLHSTDPAAWFFYIWKKLFSWNFFSLLVVHQNRKGYNLLLNLSFHVLQEQKWFLKDNLQQWTRVIYVVM